MRRGRPGARRRNREPVGLNDPSAARAVPALARVARAVVVVVGARVGQVGLAPVSARVRAAAAVLVRARVRVVGLLAGARVGAGARVTRVRVRVARVGLFVFVLVLPVFVSVSSSSSPPPPGPEWSSPSWPSLPEPDEAIALSTNAPPVRSKAAAAYSEVPEKSTTATHSVRSLRVRETWFDRRSSGPSARRRYVSAGCMLMWVEHPHERKLTRGSARAAPAAAWRAGRPPAAAARARARRPWAGRPDPSPDRP